MSRIGRKPITVPSGVNITLDNTSYYGKRT